MILFRPVGMVELRLVYEAELGRFPPRLPEQPIFYPVLNSGYAEPIARDWNTKSHPFAGYVTRFEVEDDYATRFDRHVVGGREHEELWVPAEDLREFNRRIVCCIGVVGAYFGPRFVGHVPEGGSFGGRDAVDQLVLLAELLQKDRTRFEEVVVENHVWVFLHHLFWGRHGHPVEGVGEDERLRTVAAVRSAWSEAYPDVPLTMKA